MPRLKIETLRFRCTPQLKEQVEDIADEQNMSVSDLLREIVTKAIWFREKRKQKKIIGQHEEKL